MKPSKFFLMILIFLGVINGIFAVDWNVTRLIGTTTQTYASTLDSSGNSYQTGYATIGGVSNMFVSKYNSVGAFQWSQTRLIGTATQAAATGISVDNLGNSYQTGYATIGGVSNIFVSKYNSVGAFQWSQTRLIGTATQASGITLDNLGNSYQTGYATIGGVSNMFVSNYNSVGVLQWSRTRLIGTTIYPSGISVDNLGNSYQTGYATIGGVSNMFVSKYNSVGAFQWSQTRLIGTATYPSGISVDNLGNSYQTGRALINGNWNSYITKYNSAGVLQWSHTNILGPYDIVRVITLDDLGNIYQGITKSVSGNSISLINIYDNNGNFLQNTSLNLNSYNDIYGISTDNLGNIYHSGTIFSSGIRMLYAAKVHVNFIPITKIELQNISLINNNYIYSKNLIISLQLNTTLTNNNINISYSLDNQALSQFSTNNLNGTLQLSNLNEGLHTIYFYANNNETNYTSEVYTFTVDTIFPLIRTNTINTTSIINNTINKIGLSSWNNQQVYIINPTSQDVYINFTTSGGNAMIGLSSNPSSVTSYTDIDYKFYVNPSGYIIYGTSPVSYNSLILNNYTISYIKPNIVFKVNNIVMKSDYIGYNKILSFASIIYDFGKSVTITGINYIIHPTINISNISLINNSYFNINNLNISLQTTTFETNNNINISYSLDNQALSQFSTNNLNVTLQLSNLNDGLHTIYFYAYNNETNYTSEVYTFTVDITAPVIQTNFTGPIHLNNYTYNFSNYINITDLHNATYNISINNQPSNYTHIFIANGNYTIKIIAKDFLNNTNIYTTNIIVDLFRINMTFQSNISSLLFNNINITENPGALNYLSNTSNKVIYRNPGSYNFTFNKSLYNISTILNYTKDNVTPQQNLLVTFKPIFIFNLIDEQSLLPFNISGATSIIFKTYCADGSVLQKSLSTHIYNYIPSCSPTNFGFNIIYGTQNYFRDITAQETNLNRSVYLMDLFKSQMVQNNFVIFDLTSKYSHPRLSIQKIIPNKGQVEITGDKADIQNSVTGYLLQNSEYILQLSSDNQPTKNLGIYIASAGGTENINLFDVNFKINNPSQGKVQMHSYIQNGTIISTYNDLSNSTILADLKLYNQTIYGNIIFQSQISNNPQSGSFSYNIPNSLENTSLLAILTITTNTGIQIDKRIIRQNNNLSLGLLGFTLSMDWIITIFLAFIALIFTIRTADIGSILLMIFAAFFVTIGWYSLSWIVISIGLLLSILKILREGERE